MIKADQSLYKIAARRRQVLRYVEKRAKSGQIQALSQPLDKLTARRVHNYYQNLHQQSELIVNYDEFLSQSSKNVIKKHVELFDHIEELIRFFVHDLPKAYGLYMFRAAQQDAQLFKPYIQHPISNLQLMQSKSPFVSDFDYFLHLSALKAEDFINLVLSSHSCLEMMFCTWNALEQHNLLLGIENLLNEYYYNTLFPESSDRLTFKRGLCQVLYVKEHCTCSFIKKFYHYRYQPEAEDLRDDRGLEVRKRSVFNLLNSHQSQHNLISALMLIFYIMGLRTICGLSPFSELFSLNGLPTRISPYLAYGSYKVVKDLFSLSKFKALLKQSSFTIPNFQVYYCILNGYLEGELELCFCKDCGALQIYYGGPDLKNQQDKIGGCHLCGGNLHSCQELVNLLTHQPTDLLQ